MITLHKSACGAVVYNGDLNQIAYKVLKWAYQPATNPYIYTKHG